MSPFWRVGLIAAGALCLSAAEPDAGKFRCTQAGLVIGVELVGESISFKNPQGLIARIKTDNQTVITQAVEGQSEPVKIHRARVENGDLICADVPAASKPAARVFAVPRSMVEKRRHEFLAQWQQGSLFGAIESIDSDRRGLVVKGVHVGLGPDVRYRRLAPSAKSVTEAVPFQVGDLRAGEPVYVWGVRDPSGSSIQAKLVAIGGNQAMVGTISEIQALTPSVKIHELESGQDVEVRIASSQLYRTAPRMTSPTEIKTPAGVPLARVGFVDIKVGDSVLVIGNSSEPGSKMAGVILISSFGEFGVSPDDPSGQLTWFFK